MVAPLIRDLGAALAMHPEPETVRMVLNAQAGKAGLPMGGRDLHIGDMSRGILPAAAPLSNPSWINRAMIDALTRRNARHPTCCGCTRRTAASPQSGQTTSGSA